MSENQGTARPIKLGDMCILLTSFSRSVLQFASYRPRNKNLVVQYRPQTHLASWRMQPSLLASEIRRLPLTVADLDLQIILGEGGHPDPEIWGGGLRKFFFGPSGLSLV